MKFNIIEQFDNNLKDNEFSIVIKNDYGKNIVVFAGAQTAQQPGVV